ncbi:MAG TPA: PKD domain-containing protein [Phycisphaerae bacterium]|nr:PKD domain-containing protein [Phycisphaerae bacterium]
MAAWAAVSALAAAGARGGTIYVDQQISPASTSRYDPATRSAGTGGETAFKTLARAAEKATPGTTVLIRGGTYSEQLKPAHSGTPGRLVTFRNYGQEAVTLSGQALAPAIDLSGRSYVAVEGLRIANVTMWLWAVDSHHNLIRGNQFSSAIRPGGGAKTGVFFQQATFNRILDNVIENCTSDNLTLVLSERNLLAGNTLRKAGHSLWSIRGGSFNVLRDNFFHNELQKIGEVYDCDRGDFHHVIDAFNCTRRNLIDRNRFARTAPSQRSPYAGIQYAGQDGIIRRNLFYNTAGPGLDLTLYGKEANYTTGNRIYNNVFHSSDFAGLSLAGATEFTFRDNVILSNILAGSRFVPHDTRWSWHTKVLAGKPVQLLAGRRDGFLFRGNDLFGDGDPAYLLTLGIRSPLEPPQTVGQIQAKHPRLFQDNTTVEAGFVDPAKGDFSLRPGSAMIDKGQFLTRTVGGGSGSSLPVEDASYFYDGYGIEGEQGDVIQLAGQSHTARVRKIDYDRNVLLLDQALSWKGGQGVALRYAGTAPDVGAKEFAPGGNAPPVASFTARPAADTPLSVRFDASASADPDGKVAAYEWQFGDGQKARSDRPIADHTYAAEGAYRAVLTVFDDRATPASSGAALDLHVGHPRLGPVKPLLDFGPTGTIESIELTNAGTGTLVWRLADLPPWLSADPPSDSFVRSQRIELRVNRDAAQRGVHSAKVRLDAGAAGSARIDVWMRVPTLRAVELVRPGDTWRCLKGTAAPPADWNQVRFDDSKWASGPSGIGFGDLKYGLRLNDMCGNYLTFYARRTFRVADPAAVAELTLQVQYDDGFVAYVNGKEIARSASMGSKGTPTSFDAPALSKHDEEDPAETHTVRPAPGLLVAGENVLAIEVHNEWIKGTDAGVVPRLTASMILDEKTAARERMLRAAGVGGGGCLLAALTGWGLWKVGPRKRLWPALAAAVRGGARQVVDWALVVAAGGAIVVLSLCPPGMLNTRCDDKKLHALAYGVLTMLLLRAITGNGALVRSLTAAVKAVDRRVGLVKVCLVLAAVMVVGTAIEFVQPMFGRDRSVRDIAANLAGGCLAVLLWQAGRMLLRRSGKP